MTDPVRAARIASSRYRAREERLRNFRPPPWTPLEYSLFDIRPPGTSEEPANAQQLARDKEWYRGLCIATTMAVVHVVSGVDWNHTRKRDVRFSGQALGRLLAHNSLISHVFLDGDPDPREVGDQINRLVKMHGLVVYDPNPGYTFGWPMVGRRVTREEVAQIVDDAFHAKYPEGPF